MRKIYAYLFVILLVAAFANALLASIDKPRMVLYKNVTPEEPLVFTESVIVNNNNDYPVDIKVEAMDDLIDLAEIEEDEFTMQPEEVKEVFYDVTIERPGNYKGDIVVKFSETDSNVGAALAQTVIILVQGEGDFGEPVEEEEAQPEEQENTGQEAQEDTDEQEEEIQVIQTENTEENDETEQEPVTQVAEDIEGSGPKALIGILIIMGILVLGVLVYALIFMRGGKK